MRMSDPDWSKVNPNAYITFVLYAVVGKMQQADGLMRQHHREILKTAQKLRAWSPPEVVPLYRGLLIEPENMGPGSTVSKMADLEFVSWSADKDVACFFADVNSQMSSFVAKVQRPGVKGWIIEHTPDPSEVIFCWKWGLGFPLHGQRVSFDTFAKMHPDRQIASADMSEVLRAQKEYILKPSSKVFNAIAYPDTNCPATDILDKKFWKGPKIF